MFRLRGLLLIFSLFALACHADEGMWVPVSLPDSVYQAMRKAGLQLSRNEIFSNDSASLSSAIVQFNRGCSAGIISADGLLITNYHCARYFIQQHSSIDTNLFKTGFCAQGFPDELYCPGATISVVKKIIDVTPEILKGVDSTCSVVTRDSIVKSNKKRVLFRSPAGEGYNSKVESYYFNDKFYLFEKEVFTDLRLVYCPAQTIAEFGGDFDNWKWPRHCADFVIFRIYSDSLNKPAAFRKDNKPYHPSIFLKLNVRQKHENDYVMTMGYPGETDEYYTRTALERYRDKVIPMKLSLSKMKLISTSKFMQESPKIELNYKVKYLALSNMYNKLESDFRSLNDKSLFEIKKPYYQRLSPSLLPHLDTIYVKNMKLVEDAAFFSDGLMNIESIKFAMNYIDILDLSKEVTAKDIAKLKESLIVFFKTYDKNIDLDFFKKLIPVIKKYKEDHPQFHFRSFFYGKKSLRNELKEKNLALLMSKSIFSDSARFEKAKNLSDKKFIEVARKDFVLLLAHEQSFIFNRQVVQKFIANKKSLDSIQRVSFNKTKNYSRYFYPDANATLRLSFGHIKKFMCTDAVEYDYQTFTSGIIDKVDSRNAEYVVDSSYYRFLKSNMNQPVCFIANCHTTGGNSGSPVLDARGNMLGLNCDRNIQGTVNDYIYDEKRVRNIVVDASYIIFILKAFSHANHIVNSLSIIDRE